MAIHIIFAEIKEKSERVMGKAGVLEGRLLGFSTIAARRKGISVIDSLPYEIIGFALMRW